LAAENTRGIARPGAFGSAFFVRFLPAKSRGEKFFEKIHFFLAIFTIVK
jgi:hypothetical protein